MLPAPLHPAVVHFPIVLAVLLPIFLAGSIWAIRRGAAPARAWAIPVALAAAIALSGWVALQTGEAQEDRVENVVGESVLHRHEEAAERFLVLSGILAVLTAAGLLQGRFGSLARAGALAGSLVVLASAYQVGDAGGRLVYEHGAASAYATPQAAGVPGPSAARNRESEHDD